jgi:hypothetical protein
VKVGDKVRMVGGATDGIVTAISEKENVIGKRRMVVVVRFTTSKEFEFRPEELIVTASPMVSA